MLLLVSSIGVSPALAAQDASLCPLATARLERSLILSGSDQVLRAPQTEQETAAVLGAIYTGKGDQRRDAITRAALQGNLLAFRYLVEIKDWDGVHRYATDYLNEDGTVCLAPAVERTLRRNLQRRPAGRHMLALLEKNRFQSPRTFNALTRVPFDSMEAQQWLSFARAITATYLPDIDARVLEFARDWLPFEGPVQHRVLPALHRYYVGYFAERGYRPALGYFRRLLDAVPRSEPLHNFQVEYSALRSVVHEALATLGGAGARRLLIAELTDLAERPLDEFAAVELLALDAVVAEFTNRTDTDAVVAAYARLLNTPQAARFDAAMRRAVYPTLGGFDTQASRRLLLEQLQAYLGAGPPPNRDMSVELILAALGNCRELNVDPLLAGVSNLRHRSERRLLWQLVTRHPSNAGVSFLLQQLSFALRGGPQARELMGADATDVLLAALTGVQGAGYQNYARDGIDSLYDQGLLPVPEYEWATAKLSAALGNQSERYLAYLDDQAQRQVDRQAAERQALAERSRQALQGTFEVELARHSEPAAIARHIAALTASGEDSRRALQWLVLVGAPSLPQLHAALVSAATSDPHKLRLLGAISEIGSTTSIEPVIQAARSRADGLLYRPAFQALAMIEPTPSAIAFAQEQMGSRVAPAWRAAALIYLGHIRYEPAATHVTTYTAADARPRERVAALYLGARLGLKGVSERIAEFLVQTDNHGEREALLQALGEVATSPAEFARLAAPAFADDTRRLPQSYTQNLAHCAFRTADPKRKVALAYALLAEGQGNHRRSAMGYLIRNDPERLVARVTGGAGKVMPLHMLVPQSSAVQLLFSESRRLGYVLEHTGQDYALRKI